MKKIILLFTILIATVFSLASCDTIEPAITESKTNTDITIVEESKEYTVVYHVEENDVYLTNKVVEGEKVSEPITPVKKYYTFEYWTLNSNEFSFDTPISEDTELFAKWKINTAEIYLYNNDILLESLEVDVNTLASTILDIDYQGLETPFVGWFIDKELRDEFDYSSTISSDLLLYGKWEEVSDSDTDSDTDSGTDSGTINGIVVTKNGLYTSKDEVALYISTYHKLPSNYMTKSEAGGSNGANIKNIWTEENKASIGGDLFGNREGLLPEQAGRTFTELDIDYNGNSRGTRRIVFSSDFRIFYTGDHYDSFVEYDKETGEWKSY